MSLGLVLSGGGVRGCAHIGVLQALHEAKIKPAFISGTSAGSIVAGLYAYGYTPQELRLIGKQISKKQFDVDFMGIFSSLINILFSGKPTTSGLIQGDYFERYLYNLTKGIKINKIKMPLAITAVDINNTNIVVFTSLPNRLLMRNDYVFLHDVTLSEAIRASISLPGIFKPKIIKRMRLVDGGVRANLPVEITRMMGAKKVVAVNLSYSGKPVPYVDNILEIALQSIDLMVYQITRPSIASADLIISPEFNYVQVADFSKIDYLINCGYKATVEMLPRIKQLLCT
ncbi:MAG: patatin-like phospholipase family protein [Clostridia bacterium]|jgi:NTE family protein|nr:patatin-like phospholipase family protein [Clostridia bacterium]